MISNDECNAIINIDLDAIKVKLTHLESGEGWSPEKVNAVEREYRRFLYLMKMFPEEPTAPVEDVDTFWHYHILDTMKYADDCDAVFGHFLHHFPYVGMRGEEDAAALVRMGDRMGQLYERTFGEKYGAALQQSPSAAAYCASGPDTAHCASASADAAYCATTTAMAAYCAATGAKAAYCATTSAKAEYCATTSAKAAYCATTSAKAAYCATTSAKAAYCATTIGKPAYCATTSARNAYCASGAKAAYCATTGAKPAYCATTAAEPERIPAQEIEFKPGFFEARPSFATL